VINFYYITLAVFLILLNAFFVATECAMIKLRRTQIIELQEPYEVRGAILLSIHKKLNSYLSACQLGVTIASLGLGWVGEPAFMNLLMSAANYFHLNEINHIKFISFVLTFTFVSVVHMIIGEMVPKSLAISKPESVSLLFAIPIYIFHFIAYPIVYPLNLCSQILLRSIRMTDQDEDIENFYSTEELKLILHSTYKQGEITKDEADIMENTLEFADLRVTEVMRNARELVVIDIDKPISESLSIIANTKYSRYPVYNSQTKELIGIIHVKDLFFMVDSAAMINDFSPYIRPLLKVKHRMPAIEILRLFREKGSHFAIVYKAQDIIGFVTLDNLLHVLFGMIKDEFHKTKNDYFDNRNGSFTVKGSCSIYSLEQLLGCDIEDNEKFHIDTIEELVIFRLGRMPSIGTRIDLDHFVVVVTKVHNNSIDALLLFPKNE
jgi:CBS domain containing-hemolysin-like protein